VNYVACQTSTNIFFEAYVATRGNPAIEFGKLDHKTRGGSKFPYLEQCKPLPSQKKRLKMATDIEPADVSVTPDGVAGVPTTGEDGSGVFLCLRHHDYFEDDATDVEQKKEQNKKRRKTSNM
jgi:hypothetical protein